ncbi:MAG: class I SAM-dependent methyltransferase, partial [Candidatus Eremiobacterota bacterium]
RHTHCLEGFHHSVWVDNKEKFYREFDKICNSNLYDIAMESENFKNNLMKQYIEILSKPFGLDVQTIERKPLEKVIICNEVSEKTCLENELNDDFTDNGLWTPQTFMLQEINRWVRKTDFNARYALSIDNNPTLDPVILKKWPEINIVRAVYPEYDVQNLSHLKDNTFDLVYSHQVIEHIPKPWNAAKEIVRVLKQGGIGLHTTCAFNPRHGLPEFNDYYRFLPDGLAELFEGVKIIIKGGWGNRNALIHNLSVDDGHGLLGGRRFDKVIGQENDNLYPWHTWVIFMKI